MKPQFPSDIDIAKNKDLGVLRPADEKPARGFLMRRDKPYYEGGLKILEQCPEFRIIQDRGPDGPLRVEWNYSIHRRFLKSVMRVNSGSLSGDETWNDRVTLASAFDSLWRFYESNKEGLDALLYPENQHIDDQISATPNGGLGCARQIGATLGAQISEALRAEDVDMSIKDLTAAIGVSLRALARSHGLIEDKRQGIRPRPNHLISAASSIFMRTRQRPSKQAVKELLTEQLHFEMKGKNQSAAWTDLFNDAGLGDLPS